MIVSFHSDTICSLDLLRRLLDSAIDFANSRISYDNPWMIEETNKLELSSSGNIFVTSIIGVDFKGLRYTKESRTFTYHPRKKGPSAFMLHELAGRTYIYTPGHDAETGMKFYRKLTTLYAGINTKDYKILTHEPTLLGIRGTMTLSHQLWSYFRVIFKTLSIDNDGNFSTCQGEYMFNFASPDGNDVIKLNIK